MYAGMTVGDYLFTKTKVGDVVVLRDCGWFVGLTKIDHEDLFMRVLDSKKCLNREIEKVVTDQWFRITSEVQIKVTEVWYK